MLALFCGLIASLFLSVSNYFWYTLIWTLCLMALLSIPISYTSTHSYSLYSSLVGSDTMSSALVCLTLWISVVMLLASQQVKVAQSNPKSFAVVVLLLTGILLCAFLMSNVLLFYFLFEASLIPTLILILGWGYQPERLQAGMYMMMYTLGASLPLLLGLVWLANNYNSPSMLIIHSIRTSLLEESYLAALMSVVFFLAFMVKLPVFGAHLWLPKAHVEAPIAGSMVLAAVLLKLGGYGLIRMYQYTNYISTKVNIIFIVLALVGGSLASIICFRQVDLKGLVAYSSIGHMGLVMAGIFLDSTWSWFAALILMISHGFCSSALFVLANYSYLSTGTRSLYLTKGMLLSSPALSLGWFLFAAVNMAAPPSPNLVGEIFMYASSLSSSMFYGVPVGVMSFLAAVFSMYLYTQTQHGGAAAYVSPHIGLKPSAMNVLSLHWIPANLFILKVHFLYLWLC